MTLPRVDNAVFAAENKIIGRIARKGKCSDGHSSRLLCSKFHWFLDSRLTTANSIFLYLWFWEHVQTPGAHFSISWNRNKIMSVLTSDDIETVYWMCMGRGTEFCTLHRRSFECSRSSLRNWKLWLNLPIVPDYNLTTVGSTNQQIRVISMKISSESKQKPLTLQIWLWLHETGTGKCIRGCLWRTLCSK